MVRLIPFLFILALNSIAFSQSQKPRDFKTEAGYLKKVLDDNHYNPPPIDDAFSLAIWESILNQLDVDHVYFDEKDIQNLTPFANSIDEEWKGERWEFLKALSGIYHASLLRGNTILADELSKPIQWETSETFNPIGLRAGWSKGETEQKSRWKLWIKYKALTEIMNQQTDSIPPVKDLTIILGREKTLKQRIHLIENRRIRRILENPNGFDNYVASIYFRTITTYYDPHSLYFSPSEFQRFKGAVSTKQFAFGIGFNEDQQGNIIIEHVAPGGPAWKSRAVHKGDMVTEMKWAGQSSYDLAGIGLEEFIDLLDHGNPTELELTIRLANGLIENVPLRKEKINSEENTVKGFVLQGIKKIGYISLPGFYTQWDSDDVSSCANDVASEIIKLKGENIEGLILDIRSNGGGSLKEAIEMAGIFIDEGPLAMIGDKTGKPQTIKDLNRGTVYDGPLIIMINSQSASASEVLAGAIQDYHRGLIVGSRSYGKATGQVVFPLDPVTPKKGEAASNNFGYATVTLERLYRVTGKSNQGAGVVPDLKLPDLYDLPAFHETAQRRALTKDSIQKKTFFVPLAPLPLADLRQLDINRVKNEESFEAISVLRDRLKTLVEDSAAMVLKWQDFMVANPLKVIEKSEKKKNAAVYQVSSPQYNAIRISIDPYLKEYTETLARNLQEDVYVRDAFYIMNDYIKLNSKR